MHTHTKEDLVKSAFSHHLFCMCYCETCWDGDCICEDCDCKEDLGPLPSKYYRESPAPHLCEICGTEVFRKGNKGRYPRTCPDCKDSS